MRFYFLKDARYFQLLFQTAFLCYGIFYLHWKADGWLYFAYFATCVCTQITCTLLFQKVAGNIFSRDAVRNLKAGIPSALITAFGLSLLLKTNHWPVAALAAFIAIFSKYIIRINGKHIFNPSALGIVVAILLTGDAWINAGQWGNEVVLFFAICCLGWIVVTRVQQLDLSLAFLASFALLSFIRQIIFLGWPLDFFIQSMSTGSLLLFSFFMITDPKTTPNHPRARMLWAASIGVMSFYLSAFWFVNAAPIWVLVFAQPLVPVLDKLFKGKSFDWKSLPKQPAASIRFIPWPVAGTMNAQPGTASATQTITYKR